MKPKKLKKLLASLSDVPIGCYTSGANHVGWHDLTTKEADAIRNALAEKIRRKERKKADGRCLAASLAALRWVQAGFADGGCSCALEDSVDDVDHDDYREHDSYCAEYVDGYIDDQLEKITGQAADKSESVPRSDWVSTPDVCIGVNGYVDSVSAFNLAQDAEARARILAQIPVAQASVRTGEDAVVALRECAAHIGMNASVESIPLILDNLPRIVKDLVVSSKWPTRAGGWEDCSSEDAELTRSVPNGGEPRHFRRLRPECSPVISQDAGFYWITWKENGDTLRMFLHRSDPGPVQKLSPEGTWVTLEDQDDHLDLAARLESVAADLRLGAVDQDIVNLFQGVEALRKQKAVQS